MGTFREKKVFKKSWQRIDTTKGEYLPLGAIIIKEGGWSDRSAIRGANQIDHDQKWAWARNIVNQGVLVKAMDNLKGNLGTFGRMFVTEEVADTKNKFDADHFNVELSHFLNVQPLVDKLVCVFLFM